MQISHLHYVMFCDCVLAGTLLEPRLIHVAHLDKCGIITYHVKDVCAGLLRSFYSRAHWGRACSCQSCEPVEAS